MTDTGAEDRDLGFFAEGVALWSKWIATAPPEKKPEVFRNCAAEGAQFINKGADRAAIADELFARAERHDLVDALGGVDGVQAIIAEAFAEVPRQKANGPEAHFDQNGTPEHFEPRGNPSRIEATCWRWIDAAAIPRRAWLYGTCVIRKFVAALVAPGGAGKSSLMIAELLEMVTGKPMLTGRTSQPLRVWYLNLEDPRDEIDRRIAAACIAYKISPTDLGGRLFTDTGRERAWEIASYRDGQRHITINAALIEAVIAEVKRRTIDVLIVDPLKRIHKVDENDNTAMDLVMQQLARIADEGNCGVVVVHHTRKTAGTEITAETSRGAKAVVDSSRVTRTLNTMTEAEAGNAGVEERRRHFRTYPDKLNLAPPPEASDWYRLESIPLGNGPDGAAGDNVGVAMPWTWPNAFTGVTAATLLAVQKRIEGGVWRESPQADQWVGNAVAEVLGLDVSRKADRARINTLLKTWLKSGALKVVERPDERRRPKAFVEVGEWAV